MKKVIGGIEVPMPGGLVYWEERYQWEPEPSPKEADNVAGEPAQKKGIFERVDRKPHKPKS